MTVAEQVKAWRRGFTPPLTQVQAAFRIGVDPMTVSRWERGQEPTPLARKRLETLRVITP